MKFKPGDFVVATDDSPYCVTNSNMLLGIITSCDDNRMFVDVLAHNDKMEIGSRYYVNPLYFKKLSDEQLKKNPLCLLLTCYMYDAYGGYNIPFFEIENDIFYIHDSAFVAGEVYSQNINCTINGLINIITKYHNTKYHDRVVYKK